MIGCEFLGHMNPLSWTDCGVYLFNIGSQRPERTFVFPFSTKVQPGVAYSRHPLSSRQVLEELVAQRIAQVRLSPLCLFPSRFIHRDEVGLVTLIAFQIMFPHTFLIMTAIRVRSKDASLMCLFVVRSE